MVFFVPLGDQKHYFSQFVEQNHKTEFVEQMEGELLALEQSLALFERGQALAKHCGDLLTQAEIKVRQLTGNEIAALQEEKPD